MSLPSGYVFTARASTGAMVWALEVYHPTGREKHVGRHMVNGVRCNVYHCADGNYRAAPVLALRAGGAL